MPITAKLSRKFYETLGDEVTNELVTWLNAVDESYRAEFRDLFGANFGQVRAEMAALRTEVRAEMSAFRAEVRADLAAVRGEFRAELGLLEGRFVARVGASERRLIRFMVGFWITNLLALAATLVAAARTIG